MFLWIHIDGKNTFSSRHLFADTTLIEETVIRPFFKILFFLLDNVTNAVWTSLFGDLNATILPQSMVSIYCQQTSSSCSCTSRACQNAQLMTQPVNQSAQRGSAGIEKIMLLAGRLNLQPMCTFHTPLNTVSSARLRVVNTCAADWRTPRKTSRQFLEAQSGSESIAQLDLSISINRL